MKICSTCKRELPLEKFNKKNDTKDGYTYLCKDCIKIKTKKYREKNKEKLQKYREENREVLRQRSKKQYEKNKKVLNKKRTENRHKKKEEYNEYMRIYRHKTKAIKNQLENALTIKQWEKIKKAFDYKCAYCGKTEKEHLEQCGQQLHQEHFMALTNGGEYTHNNIIAACKNCNSSKNNRDFFEWYPKYEHYSKEREEKILKFFHYNGDKQQLTIAV